MMFYDDHAYDDILNMPHHISAKHPRMDFLDRAAQFSPFAALTGYDAAIEETARLTEEKVELDEDRLKILDRKLSELMEGDLAKKKVSITYFVPDEKKKGGKYVTVSGNIKKLDKNSRQLILDDDTIIPVGEVTDIFEG